MQLTKVHRLLERRGVRVPYSSLHRFVVKHCALATGRVTVRMSESAPGEVAEADFGRLGRVWDPVAGRLRVLWALVVTLVYSRHQYVHTTFSQKREDVIAGLEDAWLFFGGVAHRLVIDNLTPAVRKADRYDPIFQRVFEEYAHHRGFTIDAAVVAHPTGKPRVERSVPYVRENFFRGEEWRDRDHVQRHASKRSPDAVARTSASGSRSSVSMPCSSTRHTASKTSTARRRSKAYRARVTRHAGPRTCS